MVTAVHLQTHRQAKSVRQQSSMPRSKISVAKCSFNLSFAVLLTCRLTQDAQETFFAAENTDQQCLKSIVIGTENVAESADSQSTTVVNSNGSQDAQETSFAAENTDQQCLKSIVTGTENVAESADSQSTTVVNSNGSQDAQEAFASDPKDANHTVKKRGVPKGTKRGLYNKDGSLRQKPGRKSKKSVANDSATTVVNSNGSQGSQEASASDPKDANHTVKKRGVPKGTKRGLYNKDGSLRQKPGRKPRM